MTSIRKLEGDFTRLFSTSETADLINANLRVCIDAICCVPEFQKNNLLLSSFLYKLAEHSAHMLGTSEIQEKLLIRLAIMNTFDAALLLDPTRSKFDADEFRDTSRTIERENARPESKKEILFSPEFDGIYKQFLVELAKKDRETYLRTIVTTKFMKPFNILFKHDASPIPSLLLKIAISF